MLWMGPPGVGKSFLVQPLGYELTGDLPSATAIVDCFLHRAEIVMITGRSYRLCNQSGE